MYLSVCLPCWHIQGGLWVKNQDIAPPPPNCPIIVIWVLSTDKQQYIANLLK